MFARFIDSKGKVIFVNTSHVEYVDLINAGEDVCLNLRPVSCDEPRYIVVQGSIDSAVALLNTRDEADHAR